MRTGEEGPIGLERLRILARTRRIGFIARAAEAAGKQVEQWLFTRSDLMVLAMLYSPSNS